MGSGRSNRQHQIMTEQFSSSQPPPTGSAPPPTGPRVHRSKDDRMIAGVCGGLGRALGVDPVIFRIVLAVLAVFGGIGLLLYGAAWLLIPDDGTDVSDGARLLQGHSSATTLAAIVVGIVGILAVLGLAGSTLSSGLPVLLVIGVVVAVVAGRRPGGWLNRTGGSPGGPSSWSRDRVLLVPAAIVAGAVGFVIFVAVARVAVRVGHGDDGRFGYGYSRGGNVFGALVLAAIAGCVVLAIVYGRRHLGQTSTSDRATGPVAGPPPTQGAAFWHPTEPLGPPAGFSPSRPFYTPPAPRPPRQPSFLVPLTLFLGVVTVGVLLALGASGRVDITAQDLFAAALLATGLGLVTASWLGRGKLLIPVGILLTFGLIVAAIVNVPLRGGVGNRQTDATTLSQVQSPYRLAVGQEDLELQSLALAGSTAHVDVTVGVGRVFVRVPDDVKIVVRAYAGAGRTDILGIVQGGTHVDHTVLSGAHPTLTAQPQAGELDLNLRVGVGDVTVIRESATGGQS
jgi:phage shock protein PspC (stress-responsive transcriptional regulator)